MKKKRIVFKFSETDLHDLQVARLPGNKPIIPPWNWVEVKTQDGKTVQIPDPSSFYGRIAGAIGLVLLLCGCASNGVGGAVALPEVPGLPPMPPVKRTFAQVPAAVKPQPAQFVMWQYPSGFPVVFEVWSTTNLLSPFTLWTNVPDTSVRMPVDKPSEFFAVRARNLTTGETSDWGTR